MPDGIVSENYHNREIQKRDKRIADLEAAALAAKVLLEPTTEATEQAWQVLDDAYHRETR